MQVRNLLAAAAAGITLMVVPAIAQAQNAVATATVNVRQGPGTNYAAFASIPAGAQVNIYGCTRGYGWCDTAYGNIRGWVSASYLASGGPQRRRITPEVGASIGIGIIAGAVLDQLLNNDRDRHDARESGRARHNDWESRRDRHDDRESRRARHDDRESRRDRHNDWESRRDRDRHNDWESRRAGRHDQRQSRDFRQHNRRESAQARWHNRQESRFDGWHDPRGSRWTRRD